MKVSIETTGGGGGGLNPTVTINDKNSTLEKNAFVQVVQYYPNTPTGVGIILHRQLQINKFIVGESFSLI